MLPDRLAAERTGVEPPGGLLVATLRWRGEGRGAAEIRITPRFLRGLLLVAVGLVLLHFFYVVARFGLGWPSDTLRYIADLNSENTLGTWFSTFVLAGAALVAWLLAEPEGRSNRRGWRTIAAMLTAASIDEVATFHELVGAALRSSLDLDGVFLYAWILPAGLVVAVLGVSLLPFLLRLPRPVGRLLIIAGLIYVLGALGLELAEGWLDTRQMDSVGTAILTGVEEAMEMGGVLLALSALLGHAGELRVSLPGPAVAPPSGLDDNEIGFGGARLAGERAGG